MTAVGYGVLIVGYLVVFAVLFGLSPAIVTSYVWGALMRESWWQRILLQLGTFLLGWGVFGVVTVVVVLGNTTGNAGSGPRAFEMTYDELVQLGVRSTVVAPFLVFTGEVVLFVLAQARKKDTTTTFD